jgi:hypothetical protein
MACIEGVVIMGVTAGVAAAIAAYANDDPVNFSDPTGMWSWGSFLLTVGGAIVLGAVAGCAGAAVTAPVPREVRQTASDSSVGSSLAPC